MDERHQTASVATASAPSSGSPSTGGQSASSTSTSMVSMADVRHGEGMQAFLEDLVARQCALLEALAGVIMVRPTREQPSGSSAKFTARNFQGLTPRQHQLIAEMGSRAAKENRPLVENMSSGAGLLTDRPEYRVLATPLRLAGRPQGASVCVLPNVNQQNIDEMLTRLDLSGMLLESFLWRQQAFAEAESKIQLRETLDLLDKSQQGENHKEMGSLLAHELQRRFGCSRVSIGLVHGHAIRVVAISGVENVDRKAELSEAIEAVMEECADQDIEIRTPQPEDLDPSERRVVRAHESLSERFGPCSIASFPLRVEEGLIGVVAMERERDDPFNENTLRLLRLVAEYIGPALWTRRLADRGILAVTRDRTIDFGHFLVGPQKTAAKVLALITLLILLAAVAIPVPDRVLADSRIIAEDRRQISAPFEGAKVDEVLVSAGDTVEAGQPLIRMDTRDLRFELARAESDLEAARVNRDDALAQGEHAASVTYDAQIAGLTATVGLLRDRIARADKSGRRSQYN
ncbi:MAG: GAF domain-containing protein [Planctomycetota bacterium]